MSHNGKSKPVEVPIGKTKNAFYPLQKIGQGAKSVVHEGHYFDEKIGKTVPAAVKVISDADLTIYENGLKVFKKTSEKGEGCVNLVQLFDWVHNEEQQTHYFVMEKSLCNLETYIEDNKNLSEIDKKGICKDIAKGLHFLHERNILHRDIKPENILIFEENGTSGSRPIAKLSDFGVSREMSSQSGTVSNGCGTKVWMSLEAITALHEGKIFLNTTSMDIFSLGMVFYFIFSGKHPFAKSEQHGCDIITNIKDPSINPDFDRKFFDLRIINLLTWMLEKNSEERPDIIEVLTHSAFLNDRQLILFYRKNINRTLSFNNFLEQSVEIDNSIDRCMKNYIRDNLMGQENKFNLKHFQLYLYTLYES